MGRVLFRLSLRNIFAHRTSSFIVGLIIFVGTFLVVVGTALLDSVNASMARSITSSIAGHLQLYDRDARDELALFGSMFMGGDDFGKIDDFAELRRVVEAHPNVRAVVPMGTNLVTVFTGNEIDVALEELRAAVKAEDERGRAQSAAKLRKIAIMLQDDVKNRLPVSADKAKLEQHLEDLQTVLGDAFWLRFSDEPEEILTFLDTRLAPIAADGQLFYFRNLGTDLGRFSALFDRFEVAKGEMIPEGQPGFLFADRLYETLVKHRVARELDKIYEECHKVGKRIASEPELGDRVKRLVRQYRRISFQLSPQDAQALEGKLRALLAGRRPTRVKKFRKTVSMLCCGVFCG